MLREYQNDGRIYHNYISTVSLPGFDFVIYYAERMDQSTVIFPHQHNLFEAFYCLEGSIRFCCDGQTITLHPNHVVVLGKDHLHHIRYHPQEMSSYFALIFDIIPRTGVSAMAEREADEILHALAKIGKQKFAHAVCDASYASMLKEIEKEISQHQIGWSSLTNLLIYALFIMLLRTVASVTSEVEMPVGYKNIALTASKYIHANYMDKITIDMVAKQLNITPRHVNRLFNDLFGKPFAQTVNFIRTEYAKQYLLSTTDSIERIAVRVGLPSGKVTKLFREHEGLSPSAYRAANRHLSKDAKEKPDD